jgi:O-antigen/teichoic acid export membrane protein
MVTRGIFQETVAKAVLILSGFVLNIFLARKLGPAEYGIVGIVSSILFVFEIFLTNGIRQSISKIISSRSVNLKALWKKSFAMQMILCLILIIIGLVTLNWIVDWLKIEAYKQYLLLIFLIIPFEGAFYVNMGFLNGFQRYRQHAFANSAYSLTRVVFSLLLLYVLNNGVLAVLLGTLIAYGVSPLFTKIAWAKEKSSELVTSRQLIDITLATLIFYLLVNIFMNLDVLLLRGFGMSEIQVGFYKANASIGIAVYFLFASVYQVAYPLLSKLYAQKSIVDLKKVVNTLFLSIFYATSLAFVFTSIFSKDVILLLFGSKYAASTGILPWYVLGIGLLSLVIMLGNMMIAFEHNYVYLAGLFIALIIYVLLVFVLIKSITLLAPPIALTIVSIMIIGLLIYLINRKNEYLFEVKKIALNVGWLILTIAVALYLNNYLGNDANHYVVGGGVFIVYALISFLTSNEVRSSVMNSVSILSGAKK